MDLWVKRCTFACDTIHLSSGDSARSHMASVLKLPFGTEEVKVYLPRRKILIQQIARRPVNCRSASRRLLLSPFIQNGLRVVTASFICFYWLLFIHRWEAVSVTGLRVAM